MVTLPLFHGTSSVFVESIKRCGLGGRDVVAEFGAVRCLKELRELAVENLAGSEWWTDASVDVEAMCQQTITSGGFNYRHGTAYLSPSEVTAVRYAVRNCLGSELLSTCAKVHRRLRAVAPGAVGPIDSAYPWLAALLEGARPTPILVRADQVALELLADEGGRSLEETLHLIETHRHLGHEALQQFNLQLREPLATGLTFFTITLTGGHAFSPEYRLERVSDDGAP